MKNNIKTFCVIAFLIIVGLSMIACDFFPQESVRLEFEVENQWRETIWRIVVYSRSDRNKKSESNYPVPSGSKEKFHFDFRNTTQRFDIYLYALGLPDGYAVIESISSAGTYTNKITLTSSGTISGGSHWNFY